MSYTKDIYCRRWHKFGVHDTSPCVVRGLFCSVYVFSIFPSLAMSNIHVPYQQTNGAAAVGGKQCTLRLAWGSHHEPETVANYSSSWSRGFFFFGFEISVLFPTRPHVFRFLTVNLEAAIEGGTVVPRLVPGCESAIAASIGDSTAVMNGTGYMLPLAFTSFSNGMSFANLGVKP